MNIISQLGYIAIGTRFRILTDRLMQDADKVYKSLEIDFEPRWFTVFYLINQKKQITTTELAEQLGYSQPAITQIINSLIKKKIIKAVKSRDDSRKKVITIAPKGEPSCFSNKICGDAGRSTSMFWRNTRSSPGFREGFKKGEQSQTCTRKPLP